VDVFRKRLFINNVIVSHCNWNKQTSSCSFLLLIVYVVLRSATGKRHASEVGSLAVDLVKGLKAFKIPHLPEEQLKLRIGLHTGLLAYGPSTSAKMTSMKLWRWQSSSPFSVYHRAELRGANIFACIFTQSQFSVRTFWQRFKIFDNFSTILCIKAQTPLFSLLRICCTTSCTTSFQKIEIIEFALECRLRVKL